jgi:hypothetical protein
MTTEASQTSRPGVSAGPTSEFSLFFHVTPGHGDDLREALRALQDHPGYRPGEHNMAIATIHEARFVLFDDDTRLLFATSFDGPWDAYMDDFFTSGPTLALRRDLPARRRVRRARPGAVQAFVLGAQLGGCLCTELRRYGERDRKAERVNKHSSWCSTIRKPGPRCNSRPEAVARRGSRLGSGDGRERRDVGSHLGTAGSR